MKTEEQLYADDFGYRTWILNPSDFLVPVPADAAQIVDAYRIATIERRTDRAVTR